MGLPVSVQFVARCPVSLASPRTNPHALVPIRSYWALLLGLGALFLASASCTTLREVSNLRKVQFSIDPVSSSRLAGVDLARVQSYEDLRTADVLRLGAALSEGELPFSFDLHLRATNPESNSLNARLTEMDWTLLLEETETISGRFAQEVVLPPGDPTEVTIPMELDLVRFFDDNLQGLVDLAAALGGDKPPQTIQLRVQPTVNTRLGRFRYPSPITVVRKEVGRADSQP